MLAPNETGDGSAFWLHSLWHPLHTAGYQFWSGIGSDLGEVTLITVIVASLTTYWRKHNCHVHRCWRLAWHPREDGHPVCRRHHPDSGQITAESQGES